MASPKKRGYVVTSRILTREEKIAKAKEEIIDSYVDMKCLSCGFEDRIDFEDLLEFGEDKKYGYPVLICPQCGKKKLIPKSVFNEDRKMSSSKKSNPNS